MILSARRQVWRVDLISSRVSEGPPLPPHPRQLLLEHLRGLSSPTPALTAHIDRLASLLREVAQLEEHLLARSSAPEQAILQRALDDREEEISKVAQEISGCHRFDPSRLSKGSNSPTE